MFLYDLFIISIVTNTVFDIVVFLMLFLYVSDDHFGEYCITHMLVTVDGTGVAIFPC